MVNNSIAESVLGMTLDVATPPSDERLFACLLRAHQILTGERLNAVGFADEFLRLDEAEPEAQRQFSTDDAERYTTLKGLRDIVDRKRRLANLFVEWPTYHGLVERYGARADGSGRALLIGSHSALTSRTFEVMAHEELGVNSAIIADINAGKDKLRHGTFVFGSGLELPFAAQSMKFVLTNRLINMLEDTTSNDAKPLEQQAIELLGEASRVLAPGGQLLMSEMLPGLEHGMSREEYDGALAEMVDFMNDSLGHLGLSGIVAEQAWIPVSLDYMFDPERNFQDPETFRAGGVFTVYARKPQ